MMRDAWAMLGVGAGFAALLGLAEFARLRLRWGGEATRKIVHVGGGLLSLATPWLFRSALPLAIVAGVCAGVLAVTRRIGLLPAVHSVPRRTAGSEYYPLSVALLFVVGEGRAWLIVPSLLVLAVADAFAALIGSRFGRLRYQVEEAEKSVEGSLAFLAIAWPCLWFPLLLLADLPALPAALAALLVALLVTGFEAISLRGSDNLFVPLGVCVILAKITAQPLAEIAYQAASLLLILSAGGWLAWRTRTFHAGGALTALLFCYGAWSLAAESWAVAPLVGFGVYALGRRLVPARAEYDVPVRVRIAFRTAVVPLLVLVAANMFRIRPALSGVYAVAVGTAVVQSLWNHAAQAGAASGNRRALFAALGTGAVAAALLLPGFGEGGPSLAWRAALTAAVVLANEAVLRLRGRPPAVWDAFQVGLTLAATLAALVLADMHGVAPA